MVVSVHHSILVQKWRWRLEAVPRYKELHGVDPTPLLVQDYFSDEASGPEDLSDSEAEPEERAIWKARVMDKGELLGKPEHTHVFEVIRPEWRDSRVSYCYCG